MSDHIYYAIYTPGQKNHPKFVRMKRESMDTEWRVMCLDKSRKYPCEVFHRDKPEQAPTYEYVTLSRLRKVDPSFALTVAAEWDEANKAVPDISPAEGYPRHRG